LANDKRCADFDTGHVSSNDLLMNEMLDWLDSVPDPVL